MKRALRTARDTLKVTLTATDGVKRWFTVTNERHIRYWLNIANNTNIPIWVEWI